MSKQCQHPRCKNQASHGKIGEKAELCADHANDEMVNVVKRRCSHIGCTQHASFGDVGSDKAERCAEHANWTAVNVRHMKCSHSGCIKQASYGKAGGKADSCAEIPRRAWSTFKKRGRAKRGAPGSRRMARPVGRPSYAVNTPRRIW